VSLAKNTADLQRAMERSENAFLPPQNQDEFSVLKTRCGSARASYDSDLSAAANALEAGSSNEHAILNYSSCHRSCIAASVSNIVWR